MVQNKSVYRIEQLNKSQPKFFIGGFLAGVPKYGSYLFIRSVFIMAWSKSKLKSWNLVISIEYQGEKSLIVTLIMLEWVEVEWVEAEQGEDEPADVEQAEV